MMKYLTKEVRIGIAGIIALCILVYGINYLKGIHMFKPTNYFYVKFHNINGLTKSSPVFADGFRVGIVRDLYYDYNEPGKVVAEIDVDPELRIPKGSTAELASELMGGVKMNLLLANNPREKYLTGDTLQGNVNNGVMDQVATIMPQVEKMLPKLDSILASLNTILGDPAIPGTLHSVQNTMASMESTLIENPARYITKNAPIRETGITIHGTSVTRQSRRKRKMMMITSTKASYTVDLTSLIDARINLVLSKP